MKLGIHVSTAGSLDQAIDRAVSIGCNTFQIFVSNPRGWKPVLVSDSDATLFKTKYRSAKMEDAIAHSIYLINLASNNPDFVELSIESLISALITVEKLGLSGLVTHIGSYKGGNLEDGINKVVDSIKQVLNDATCCASLLLENTAGAGNLIGKNFSELGQILALVNSERLGICLDTAHAFEYGYDIRTEKGLEALVSEIEQYVGINNLKAIHLNDSMTDISSNRDRHAEFGEGLIGSEGLTRLINHPKLKSLPFIMETPKFKSGEVGRDFLSSIRKMQR